MNDTATVAVICTAEVGQWLGRSDRGQQRAPTIPGDANDASQADARMPVACIIAIDCHRNSLASLQYVHEKVGPGMPHGDAAP